MAARASDRGERCAREYAALKAELRDVGYLCVGTVLSRRLECRTPGCHCHKSPANRHGPYHYWTRKVRGKTVTVMLTADEAEIYRSWIENNRVLEKLVRRMRKVSANALACALPARRR